MPKGSVEIVAELSGAVIPDKIGIDRILRILTIVFVITLLIGSIIYLIKKPTRSKKHLQSRSSLPLHEEKEYVQPGEWKNLAERLEQKKFSGDVLANVSAILRDLGPRKIEHYRVLYVLDVLDSSSGTNGTPNNVLSDLPPWRKLTTRYLDEAKSLGYVTTNGHSLALSESGKHEISEAKTNGYDKDFWEFVEHRLNETLYAECPCCGETNQVHWYWQTFDCQHCHEHIDIKDCPNALCEPSP